MQRKILQRRPIVTPGSKTELSMMLPSSMRTSLQSSDARHVRPRYDAASGDHGVDRHAAPAVLIQHEFRGRMLRLVGPYRPLMIVDIQLRIEGDELHVRFVKGVDVAHVAPIILRARFDIVERVGKYAQPLDRRRDDIPPEVVIARLVGCIVGQQLLEPIERNDVDAHRGPSHVVVAQDGIRVLRFFREFHDPIGFIRGHDPELVRAIERHIDDADGDVRFALLVISDHRAVVHFVNMIARQDQHVRRIVRADELEILVHRIGGAAIPMDADLLLRGNQFDELAQFAAQVAPAALDVLDQGLRLVLRQNGNLPDARNSRNSTARNR